MHTMDKRGRPFIKISHTDSGPVCVMQLLRDASGGRLDVHLADALEFDMATHCGPYIKKRKWHEGIIIIMI